MTLKLTADPTFMLKVSVPAAGGDSLHIELLCNHMTRNQLAAFMKTAQTDVESIMKMARGWNLEEPFNAENVEKLAENYHSAARVIAEAWYCSLTGMPVPTKAAA